MTTDIAIRPDYVDEHIFEDYDENSSARLFERSRIKALAAIMNKSCEYLHANNAHDSRSTIDSRGDDSSSLLLLSEEDLDLYTMDKIVKILKDERENVQKKTFTKWVNSHLERAQCRIQDLYTDLRDGKMLIKLLEILSGERLPKPTKGKMRIHCLENVDKALQFLRLQHVHLENMGSHDIVDGNPRLSLGLIWTIILRFQTVGSAILVRISLLVVLLNLGESVVSVCDNCDRFFMACVQIQGIELFDTESQETRSAREALLLWCQMKTAGYPNVNVRNFTTSWRDGLAFNALIHKHRPDLISFEKLQRSNALHNLKNAFEVAENQLGITSLLDAEDVNVEMPDEKSIITYLVSYYHYFNKLRQETIQGRRIGKVVSELMENDVMIEEYERLSSDLLQWIKKTIEKLNDRVFVNSLVGVQKQLTTFNNYRTEEKPPKFVSKGNLEVLLFTLQSRMRANNQKPYLPREGRMISDINKAWENLEKAEHERELALKEELIRQEKLEQLAARFDRKAGMRETWLAENQRLVSQDNFGSDLPSVEAATKKHEAIETDIYAYEERVQAVVAVAQDLEAENYNDIDRINARKDNVLQLWNFLLELLMARRVRLELSMVIQKIFQDMIHVLGWMEELKARMLSDDYGKHLMGVEDLIQKHQLVEADVNIVGDRLKLVCQQAEKFTHPDGPDGSGYQPVEPALVQERIQMLEAAYKELLAMVEQRRQRLEDSKRLCQFFLDAEELEQGFKELEQVLSSPDVGHDVVSVNLLLAKHKSVEDQIASLQRNKNAVIDIGRGLIGENLPGSSDIQAQIDHIEEMWQALQTLANLRKQRLVGAVDYYQLFSDIDDNEAWLLDSLRILSSEDVGKDEPSVQHLIKQHDGVTEELQNGRNSLDQLYAQAEQLPEAARAGPDVADRLGQIEKRYAEVMELGSMRKQRLLDALTLYKLFNDTDNLEAWIDEKAKLLESLKPADDLEEVEIMRHRFETLEQDLNNQSAKVLTVNKLSRQLLHVEHPNSDAILQRQNRLNARWAQLQDMVRRKRLELDQAHRLQTFRIDCQETVTWIQDKTRVLEDTEELKDDLSGIMKLQRRLSMMERDLGAIQAKLDNLEQQAVRLQQERPEEVEAIRENIARIQYVWDRLTGKVREYEAKLDEAGDLQRFLRDLDHFQGWLSSVMRQVASEDEPQSLAEAEQLLSQHSVIREEIDGYAEDYAKMRMMGDRVTQDQTDPQYLLLRQRLDGLQEGWQELHRMWDNRQAMLSQALNLQMFLRDAKQAELLLNQQENYLAKDEAPTSLEQAETMLKRHGDFLTTMEAGDEKIRAVVVFGNQLCEDGHFAADRIHKKVSNVHERRELNREKANSMTERLREHVALQQFLSDCEELRRWIEEKMIRAQDETYRDAKTVHSKFMRHQAFEAEIQSNKERLQRLQEACVRLIAEKPQLDSFVDPHVAELTAQFDELESKTKEKGQRLFDANREAIYVQACEDMTEWVEAMEKQMGTEDVAQDLATVNVEIQKQQLIESEMLKRVQQVCQLQAMEPQLEELRPEEFDAIKTHRLTVQEKFSKLQAPLEQRRQLLERKKEAFQFLRDVEDEKLWIADRRPMARSPMLGDTLFDCHRLQKQNQSLKNEIENHQPWIQRICDNGRKLIASGHENAPEFEAKIKELLEALEELKKDVEKRRERLAESEKAHQYIYDANEAEVWMSEQELYMMTDDRGRDEFTTENLIKKHERQRQDVEQFADTIRDLADRAQKLIAEHAPMSDTIAIRQAQIDKSYAGLQDLSRERRHRLGETLQLFNLHRQIEDILQWIAEREVVAASQDAGQDYEHVQMLQERFRQFAKDTETIGTERVSNANEECDQLMAVHHPDAPTVALWKDNLNEAWENLLELMQTRAQMLDASCQLHKFFHDCRDTLSRILEKSHSMPEDLGRDASSVSALQRKHQNFLTDLLSLESQVKQVQADARSLQASYAGDRALEIQAREGEVLNAWRLLQANCEGRRTKLLDTSDLFRFMQMVRDLLLWMEEVKREMNTQERPKDVSGVELLMNNHQSLKAEIDAREENFSSCIALGRDLLARKHYASSEIEKKLIKLTTERAEMMRRWEDRWEYLQLILEVYQFARDAAVADAWLLAQEPYLLSKEYGRTLEEVVKLIKKHEAFEKSTIAQEERFQALEKLTTLELRAQEYLMWLRMGNRLALADMAQCGLRFMEAMESEMFELKELQRRQDEQERLRRTGSPRTSTPTRSPEKLETTFPAESGGRTETTLGVDEERRRQLHSSESPGWRISLSRSKYFDANDSVGTESAEGFEGHLIRKHTWETLDRKASIRSWDKLYCVIRGSQLEFYKDHKHREDGELYRGETPINLVGWNVEIASSYTKRRNVLSLRSPAGFEYLLQARDEDDMLRWLHQLRTAVGILETSTSSSGKASTLPAAQQPSAKKRFFGTLKKKQAL
ncbi:Spectrin beta chain [Trichinella patagoniensis]|uniref:Spectrin beta chain n=1 Tax=Trichinella patagoniensis TaxID=990121 RepID=A0A0V1A0K1_9BILA|nr:Spectrin beta chain [Trichinella patagoniensis]